MRCTQPTIDVTGREHACPTATNTFSVGFGKSEWTADDGVRVAATHRESGYPRR
jgi:hypothetical protein